MRSPRRSTALAANSRAGGQNVIILLSDGAASSTSAQMGPLKTAQSTKNADAAITAAKAAKAGTMIFVIYYDDSSPNCTDTTTISSCTTMQDIATNSAHFYSTDGASTPCASKNKYTSINAIIKHIMTSLKTARLVPISTT